MNYQISRQVDVPGVAHSRSASSDSLALNDLDDVSSEDLQGVVLLKQIFPEESSEQLRDLHHKILLRTSEHRRTTQQQICDSRPRQLTVDNLSIKHELSQPIPDDFLRLPPDVAVLRYNDDDGRWHYEMVAHLEKRALEPILSSRINGSDNGDEYFTKVIVKDAHIGLGMNVLEENGLIRVHSFNSCTDFHESNAMELPRASPASSAGILPGDILIGINGRALMESVSPGEGLLKHVASVLRTSPNPVVLHFLRHMEGDASDQCFDPPAIITMQSLLDTSDSLQESSMDSSCFRELSYPSTPLGPVTNAIDEHPFIALLYSRNLVKKGKEQREAQLMFKQFTERARQWEAQGFFAIHPRDKYENIIFVPLMGVRKALSVRVVNSFLDGRDTAYTTWVFDVESGREWYAPVRYFRDFQDLRAAAISLRHSISQFAFPKSVLSLFGSPLRSESSKEREQNCRQLESFLRALIAMVYRDPLHPSMVEIAVHVQSFLGCDSVLGSAAFPAFPLGENQAAGDCAEEIKTRLWLKRSIQRYTYRLFLLDPVTSLIDKFVGAVRAERPRLQDIESLEAQGRSSLKARALQELSGVQNFLDQLQEMIVFGCMDDFRLIAEREDYKVIHSRIFDVVDGGAYWDRLVREAVREQVEIEVYVPLRSIISRWLVNGWKHEDMEVQFKIRELGKRPELFFPIEINESCLLHSVASILKEGVGLSTLPCVKLRAIVHAASEINRIFAIKNHTKAVSKQNGEFYMGADEFLPIFIYCVVKAEMERPCALSILLRSLCDPINRLGEIGYYLASFEAAIAHLQEVDLSEQKEDIQTSFISIALDS